EAWTHPVLDVVMPYLTDFDHWRIPLVVLLLVGLARGSGSTRVGILFAIVAVAATDLLVDDAIKPWFERPRPFKELDDVRKLIGAHDYSFPSAHAANTFAAGVFLSLRFRGWWPSLLLAAVVAWSRVYCGVHYPLDILGGAVVGAALGWFFTVVETAARLRLVARRTS
ncbi:MAG: phosphatase PAP2 family protein, partial [Gemmatimonadota bacterium]|nr:phosphatase PAP2 family protein [Gemmatimonadota bacterium]